MKIAIICPYNYPVPAVIGGAVETLVELMVQNNETHKIAELTIFAKYHMDAAEASKEYKNTDFVFLDYDSNQKLYDLLNRLARKIRLNKRWNPCVSQISRNMMSKYDAVIVENSLSALVAVRNKYDGNLFFHVHSDSINCDHVFDSKLLQKTNAEVIAVSNFIRDRIVETTDKCHAVTLYNAVDIQDFHPTIGRDYSSKELTVGFCGRMTKAKGIDLLLDAFISIAEKRSHVKLLVIGSAEFGLNTENKFIQEQKRKIRSLEDRIQFTGYVSHNEVPNYLRSCNVIVVPSQCNEALPLVVLESMATGIPVIASKIGGIPELLDDCCLVDLSDRYVKDLCNRLIAIIDDPQKRLVIGNRNRERVVVEYNSDLYFNKLVSILSE